MEISEVKHGHGLFQPGSVRVVDYDRVNNNILIRGSSAFGAMNFPTSNVKALITAIQDDINFKSTGVTLNNPMIIDFCLIGYGSHKDEKIVKAEIKWFTGTAPTSMPPGNGGLYPFYFHSKAHLNPNTMIFWPVQSIGGLPPDKVSGRWQVLPTPSIEPGSGNCNFAGLIPAIHNVLVNKIGAIPLLPKNIKSIQNAVIYVHCDSGVNRTGAAVVSYLMKYGSNLSALNLSRRTQGGCYSLQQAQIAANLAHPSDDTNPPGGSDIPVASAFCNYEINPDKNKFDALQQNCVPLKNTIWP